jgi:K+-transporting ATPase A subunit
MATLEAPNKPGPAASQIAIKQLGTNGGGFKLGDALREPDNFLR